MLHNLAGLPEIKWFSNHSQNFNSGVSDAIDPFQGMRTWRNLQRPNSWATSQGRD